jgi:hypothetical protein
MAVVIEATLHKPFFFLALGTKRFTQCGVGNQ